MPLSPEGTDLLAILIMYNGQGVVMADGHEIRIASLVVCRKGKQLFDEGTTKISLEDDAAGEYIVLQQFADSLENGQMKLDPDEWPVVRKAIDRMVKSCRSYP